MDCIVKQWRKQDWADVSAQEKKTTENTILLVGLLYRMCQVKLVLKSEKEYDLNTVNKSEIDKTVGNAQKLLETIKGQA